MLKVLIFITGLISGVFIHYVIASSAEQESIKDTPSSTIQHLEVKNEKQLLREIAALKHRVGSTVGCPSTSEDNNSYNHTNPSITTWEEESEHTNSEPETLEDQFEQGQVLEY